MEPVSRTRAYSKHQTISNSVVAGQEGILIILQKQILRPSDFIFLPIGAFYWRHNMPKNVCSCVKILHCVLWGEEHLIRNLYYSVYVCFSFFFFLNMCLETILDLLSHFSLSRQRIPLPFLTFSCFYNQGCFSLNPD